jgi:hypothetical protein
MLHRAVGGGVHDQDHPAVPRAADELNAPPHHLLRNPAHQ